MRGFCFLILTACGPYLGGSIVGAADTHCGSTVQAMSTCVVGVNPTQPNYGTTMYGTAGDDDDCKYHVSFTYSPIIDDKPTTFTVHLTNKSDGSDVTGAAPLLEAFLNNHTVTTKGDPVEISPGHYTTVPVTFDESGTWTIRFHFFESCTDSTDSPHAHAAFYIRIL